MTDSSAFPAYSPKRRSPSFLASQMVRCHWRPSTRHPAADSQTEITVIDALPNQVIRFPSSISTFPVEQTKFFSFRIVRAIYVGMRQFPVKLCPRVHFIPKTHSLSSGQCSFSSAHSANLCNQSTSTQLLRPFYGSLSSLSATTAGSRYSRVNGPLLLDSYSMCCVSATRLTENRRHQPTPRLAVRHSQSGPPSLILAKLCVAAHA